MLLVKYALRKIFREHHAEQNFSEVKTTVNCHFFTISSLCKDCDTDRDNANHITSEFILNLINKGIIEHIKREEAKKGDIVIYSTSNFPFGSCKDIKHTGIVISTNSEIWIRSKFGINETYNHKLSFSPATYGETYTFFKVSSYEELKSQFLQELER